MGSSMRDEKGRFIKGSISPYKGDSSWVNSGNFKVGHKVPKKWRMAVSKRQKGNRTNIESLKKYYEINPVWNKGKKLNPMKIEQKIKIKRK